MTLIGGLFYPNVTTGVIIGSKTAAGTRTSVALTSSYQAESGTNPTKSFVSGSNSKINLDFLYTTGTSETGTTVCVKFEDSPDKINWYRIQNEAVSAGTSTLTDREFQHAGGAGATAYAFSIGLDVFYKYVRVSVKETGVSSNAGTIFAESTLLGL